jgi:CBS-domain-containing membrane protein
VFDYPPGKQGWFQQGGPREGTSTDETWLGDVADASVPTCGPDDRIRDIVGAVRVDGRETCVVINDEGIVLGVVRKHALASDADREVRDVMQTSPSTFRPNVTLEELLKWMRDHDVKTNSLVTAADGRFLGIISRADAEATLSHEGAATA